MITINMLLEYKRKTHDKCNIKSIAVYFDYFLFLLEHTLNYNKLNHWTFLRTQNYFHIILRGLSTSLKHKKKVATATWTTEHFWEHKIISALFCEEF